MVGPKADRGSLASDLHRLLESADGADVTLVAGDLELPAHSLILAARSPVFAAMLRNDMKEARSRRIEITDVRDGVLRQLLVFVYTDTAPQLGGVAAEMLAAADKYDLPLLRERCEWQLERDLRVENAAATAALAVLHHCPGLCDAAVQFIAAHPEVKATGGWARMLQEDAAAAAAEVCSQLAGDQARQQPAHEPSHRILTEEQKQTLARRLISAAALGDAVEVRNLLHAGASVNASDDMGCTALHEAVDNNHEQMVRCLIDAAADVNAQDSGGLTPLHVAAAAATTTGEHHVVWMLLAAGASANAQDADGQTPLHTAALFGCAYAAKALLLAGGRPDLRDNAGNTPADLATAGAAALFHS